MPNLGLNQKITPEFSPDFKIEQSGETSPKETRELSVNPSERSAVDYCQPVVVASDTGSVLSAADDHYRRIETILEEDLADIYLSLPPADQRAFKLKGEVTARKIAVLVSRPKIKIKKILSLIKDWLKAIPGVNKFFLEQAAKIKADKIVSQMDKNRLI
ncbi:MAG TPA: hypothetical protein PKL09_02520 [bacterium]|nr:hypothetical protein [bacterium]HNS34382.1 hypothetical protein [bacterium]HNW09509.1 hypothetical protein [bacterium]HPN81167.1 hypothetical protein [bacterium]HPW39203.1 hypothetical protein [bacterium]